MGIMVYVIHCQSAQCIICHWYVILNDELHYLTLNMSLVAWCRAGNKPPADLRMTSCHVTYMYPWVSVIYRYIEILGIYEFRTKHLLPAFDYTTKHSLSNRKCVLSSISLSTCSCNKNIFYQKDDIMKYVDLLCFYIDFECNWTHDGVSILHFDSNMLELVFHVCCLKLCHCISEVSL